MTGDSTFCLMPFAPHQGDTLKDYAMMAQSPGRCAAPPVRSDDLLLHRMSARRTIVDQRRFREPPGDMTDPPDCQARRGVRPRRAHPGLHL